MKLAFWKPKKVRCAFTCRCGCGRAVPPGECQHDFTNWTEPEATVVPVSTMFGGEATNREMQAQTRTCIKCNLFERRYC